MQTADYRTRKEGTLMIDLCSVRKIQTALRRFEETLKGQTGLSLNDAMCLCAIEKGFAEPGRLAEQLELSPSRLTRVLDSLEARKLVERASSKDDRRGVVVSLTDEGTRLITRYECADVVLPKELANVVN
jgi:DNA-binding MarR family transcriptional regulator